MGGFKKVYPPESEEEEEKYNKMLKTAAIIGKEMNETRKKILGEDKPKDKKGEKKHKKKKGEEVPGATTE